MKCPLLFTEAVPKFNIVLRIFGKEFSKFCGNYCKVDLIWISERVKNLSCDIEGVSNDYSVFDVGVSDCLVNTALDSKKLGLGYGNIDSPDKNFDDGFVKEIDV